jgi:hypothetical protein
MFALQTFKSARQATKAQGNLMIRLLLDRRNTFWTTTMWATETSMKNFILEGAHRQAMGKLQDWCDEAAVVHWNQESAEGPTWQEAWGRLQREGRNSKVNHPSPTHTAHQIPEPRVRLTGELRLK